MALKQSIAKSVNSVLSRGGVELVRSKNVYPWQSFGYQWQGPETDPHPDLVATNPRLAELQKRYAACDAKVVDPSVWTSELTSKTDLAQFRGQSPILWQLKGENNNPLSYITTYYYDRSIDRFGMLEHMTENGDFGAVTTQVDNRLVSRDLLDSFQELSFLQKHLDILGRPELNVLDIGAGYGRLAHRMAEVRKGPLGYYCTDAVAFSTFLCEFYLNHLEITDRARVLPLDELSAFDRKIDLAVNVNSFPECTLDAIGWWIDYIAEKSVPYLFLVPNANTTLGKVIRTVRGEEFRPLIEERGYRLVATEPKYSEPMLQEYGVSPTQFYLFERS